MTGPRTSTRLRMEFGCLLPRSPCLSTRWCLAFATTRHHGLRSPLGNVEMLDQVYQGNHFSLGKGIEGSIWCWNAAGPPSASSATFVRCCTAPW